MHGGLIVAALMWCPGVSALITRLVYQGNVRGEGWGWGSTRYEAMAYLIPIGYGAVAYGAVWIAGLGRVDLSRFHTNVALFVVGGTVQGLILALGEEAWVARISRSQAR